MGLFDLFKKKKTDDERDLEEVTKKESPSKDTTPIAPTMSLEDTRDEVIKLLKEERKIPAVKYVKDNAGVGLKEAKDYVDSIEAEMASNSTSEDKQSTNNTFCMGVEAKSLLDGVKLFTGTVIGTAKVGDEICIVNPGDNEVLFSDVITFDTPNVIKAKIARIELGKDRTSVDSVKNDKANFIFDEDLDYFIRTGTVFCSNGSSGNIVHQSYCAGLGNGLIRFAHLDISDEVYSKMSLTDLAELARMFIDFVKREPSLQAPEMKEEVTSKISKLGKNISKAILNQNCIYVLYSKRTGEPYLFTRNFEGPDNTIRIDPPSIIIFTEQTYRGISAGYKTDPLKEIRKIENGNNRDGIKNFLGSTFYDNGATGLSVNYFGLSIAAGYIVPEPNFEGVPTVEIPVTNPMAESLILLNGQLAKVETDDEKKIFNIYSSMLFKEIANGRFLVPMKLDGEVEKGENNRAVIKANTKISLATIPGKYNRPAVRMYTDWKRMVDAGFEPKDGWSANVVRMSDMITDFDCAINVTKPEYVAAGIYVGNEMFENQIRKYIT